MAHYKPRAPLLGVAARENEKIYITGTMFVKTMMYQTLANWSWVVQFYFLVFPIFSSLTQLTKYVIKILLIKTQKHIYTSQSRRHIHWFSNIYGGDKSSFWNVKKFAKKLRAKIYFPLAKRCGLFSGLERRGVCVSYQIVHETLPNSSFFPDYLVGLRTLSNIDSIHYRRKN